MMKRNIIVTNFSKGHKIELVCFGGEWCNECNKRFQCCTSGKNESLEIIYKNDIGICMYFIRPKTDDGAFIGVSPINVAEYFLFGIKALTVKKHTWNLGIVDYLHNHSRNRT